MNRIYARRRRAWIDGRDLVAFHRDGDVVHHFAGFYIQQMSGMDNGLTRRCASGLLGEGVCGYEQDGKRDKKVFQGSCGL